jgi:uncharacterized membrane protein
MQRRIIFLDLMRAFAVLMMVQGHTIDTFLGDQFRSYDSWVYNVWFTIRGFTAPIFMFTSGVTFTYLLRRFPGPFHENSRVRKGLYRFIILILIGYLLRYPTPRIFDFSEVSHDQWLTFFTVDSLHLIGISILFIICLAYIADKYSLSDFVIFSCGTLFFFGAFFFTYNINWANHIPIPFAAYLYQGTGSYFPIFPWSGYVICGALLGSYLAKNPESVKQKKFIYGLFTIGLILTGLFVFLKEVEQHYYGHKEFWSDNTALFFLRVGVVVMLNSVMCFIAFKVKSIPETIKQVGSHTLLVYAVHATILYGSAWIPGIYFFYGKTLNIPLSILAAVLMISLMIGMVSIIEKIKLIRRRYIAPVEA